MLAVFEAIVIHTEVLAFPHSLVHLDCVIPEQQSPQKLAVHLFPCTIQESKDAWR